MGSARNRGKTATRAGKHCCQPNGISLCRAIGYAWELPRDDFSLYDFHGKHPAEAMSLHYTIKVSKDHAEIKAAWGIHVDMSDNELISSFALTVEGEPLNTQCSIGNKACKGAAYTILPYPGADCPVTFVITTNKPDVQNGSDVLRGEKTYDDVDFSG